VAAAVIVVIVIVDFFPLPVPCYVQNILHWNLNGSSYGEESDKWNRQHLKRFSPSRDEQLGYW
jgi:hypothetical protein